MRSADIIGGGVFTLSNGNYVVASSTIGYTTWGDGTKGIVGAISPANSLSGPDYAAGQAGQIVTPLTNGNYVVSNPNLLNSAGAVMWCDGTKPTTGTMSAANSSRRHGQQLE